ncbi:ABC transporter permease [Rothia terrae]|uniref:ABC transporter permease n=1 Tax=Rothia terrae TaxID=396015 RepID=UPI002881098E|nr:ABC transporter permease [Rothia terrae]MDT0189412.1 ABC transporter permease [Rothia terrae]
MLIQYGLSLLLLVSLTVLLLALFKIKLKWQPYIAIARAVIQLTVIALLLRGILTSSWMLVAFIALMFATATHTSAKHTQKLHRGIATTFIAILTGAFISVTLIFGLGLVPLGTPNIVAVAGIIISGTMTITTLTARNFSALAHACQGEIEAWWSLGATSPVAFKRIAREAITEALTPGLDQTRATGLVTLPGTFVGALMGGASPLLAAQLQIAVLAGQTLGGAIAALLLTSIITRTTVLPQRD